MLNNMLLLNKIICCYVEQHVISKKIICYYVEQHVISKKIICYYVEQHVYFTPEIGFPTHPPV
jgi:hypothetical protein